MGAGGGAVGADGQPVIVQATPQAFTFSDTFDGENFARQGTGARADKSTSIICRIMYRVFTKHIGSKKIKALKAHWPASNLDYESVAAKECTEANGIQIVLRMLKTAARYRQCGGRGQGGARSRVRVANGSSFVDRAGCRSFSLCLSVFPSVQPKAIPIL